MAKIPRMLSAFKHYNYRLWFSGQVVSLMGSWMQMIAQGIFVYELTGNPAFLGYVSFASGIPTTILSLYGGIVADKFSKRNLMIITQTVMMILAFILSWLAFTNTVQPWMIIVLSFLLGVANAFDAPARMAFTVEMVGKEDLGNAIALNSMMFNLGTALGPAISGVVYAFFGPGWCFLINGLSFLFIIAALMLMRLPKYQPKRQTTSSKSILKDGLIYAYKHETIRTIIINIAVVTIFAFTFMTLLPAWPSKVFDIKNLQAAEMSNGFLQSMRGIGAFFAGLVGAYVSTTNVKGKFMFYAQMMFPLLLMAFALSTIVPLSYVIMLVLGFGIMIFFNMSMIIVQTHVDDDYRGRVMGLYNLAFMGLIPIGGFLTGMCASWFGEQATVFAFAVIVCVFGIILHTVKPILRYLQ